MVLQVLNVAEKPSVARAVVAALAPPGTRAQGGGGRDRPPVYQFAYTLGAQALQMHVTSVRGHMTDSAFVNEEDLRWGRVDAAQLLNLQHPVTSKLKQEMEPYAANLRTLARKCSWLVLWLDCDREGEHIAFEVIDICQSVKRSIQLKRARFSALSSRDLVQAMHNLAAPNRAEADAVDARREIDLRIGFAFTRLQTDKVLERYPAERGRVLSYGPCQFPTMGFVVERYQKRNAFVPEDFWFIYLDYETPGEPDPAKPAVRPPPVRTVFSWARNRLFDQAMTLLLYEMCTEAGEARVTSVDGRNRRRWKPLPLTTVELQKQASRKLGLTSERTMELANQLYRSGLISYPRTETDQFLPTTNFADLIRIQATSAAAWSAMAQRLLSPDGTQVAPAGGWFERPRNGQHNDGSHPPIHPVAACPTIGSPILDGGQVTRDHARVYEYVARHFLASCHKDAEASETSVTIRLGEETFVAKGLMILARNYLEVFVYDRWTSKTIPLFQIGQTFRPSHLRVDSGTTSAPELITEPELIAKMDKEGIGTDATIAAHIAMILNRQYVKREPPGGTRFAPTPLGLGMAEGYSAIGLSNIIKPHLRARMELDLKRVCTGERTMRDVVAHFVNAMRDVYQRAASRSGTLVAVWGHHVRFAQSADLVTVPMQRAVACASPGCNGHLGFKQPRSAGNNTQGGADGAQPRLFGCSSCDFVTTLPNGVITPIGRTCPLCQFPVMKVRDKFDVCVKCYANPPADIEDAAGGKMPCFRCSAECDLAGQRASMRLGSCQVCRTGTLMIRQSRNSGLNSNNKDAPASLRVACSQRDCLVLFMPSFVNAVSVAADQPECPTCRVRRVVLHFRSSAPEHLIADHTSWCLGGCDPVQRELFAEACLRAAGLAVLGSSAAPTARRVAARRSAAPRSTAAPWSIHPPPAAAPPTGNVYRSAGVAALRGALPAPPGAERGRKRPADRALQEVCPRCQQPGHASSTCNAQRRRGRGGGGSGGGPGACYSCGESGHFANACPRNGGGGAGSTSAGAVCYSCGEPGHFASNCRGGGGGGGGGRAGRGRGRGGAHGGRSSGAGSRFPVGSCMHCGGEDHISARCVRRVVDAASVERPRVITNARRAASKQPKQRAPPKCSRCRQPGHTRNRCPN